MSAGGFTSEELDMALFYEFLCARHPREASTEDAAILAWESGCYDEEFIRWQAKKEGLL